MKNKLPDLIVVFSILLIVYWLFFSGEENVAQKEVPSPTPQNVTAQAEEENEPDPSEVIQDAKPVKAKTTSPAPRQAPQASVPQEIKKEQEKGPYAHLDDSFVPFDEEGKRYITQIIESGDHLVYHGDVLIGDKSDLERILKQKYLKMGRPRKWPQGVIPFLVDEDLPNYDDVADAIEYLNVQTNIQFVRKKEEHKNFVHITKGKMDCYSYAGMNGGKQEIFLTPRCGVREILHELMHTIGFFHEQNRGDRDEYIQVIWDNIDKKNHPQFKKIPVDFIGVKGRPFDFESIMLYSSFTFSEDPSAPALLTKEGDVIPQSEALLSGEDIHRINTAYPK